MAVRSGHKVGKLLSDDTAVPTPQGWRDHGSLVVGDEVFASDGTVTNVVAVKPWGDRPLMRVTFEDGTHIDADELHEWQVRTRESRKRTHKPTEIVETRELSKRLTVPNGHSADGTKRRVSNFTIDLAPPIQLPHRELPLDPYLLGLWLGDGSKGSGGFTCVDGLERAFEDAGFSVSHRDDGIHHHVSGLVPVLRELGVFKNKHVPESYLWASAEQRLALLQGLLDTDGHCSPRGRVQFCNTNENLATSALHLARSLGIKARLSEKRATLYGKDCGPKWHVEWANPLPVFRLPRKLARLSTSPQHKVNAHRRMAIVSVEPLPGKHSGQCIQIDHPSHLYLAGEAMVPTHNSLLAAILAWWWAVTRSRAGVVLTAPTGRQVKRILWKEMRALRAMAQRLGVWELPHVAKDPGTGIQWDDGRYIVGFSTDEAENMAGFSGPEMLFIIDEASGVAEEIFEAVEGNTAGGAEDDPNAVAKVAMFSNPTQVSGYFYDAFHKHRDGWKCHHIKSADSPNVTEDKVAIPGLATKYYLDEKRKAWGGPGNPLWDVRVDGNFPSAGADTVIPLYLIEEAVKRHKFARRKLDGRLQIGCDPARFGDDETASVARRGSVALECDAVQGYDEEAVAGMIVNMAKRLRCDNHEPVYVNIDCSNGIGVGIASILRQVPDTVANLQVIETRAADKANDEDAYPNVRSELWFAVKDWLDDGGAIPDDDKLLGDLAAPKYDFDNRGRQRVEKKDVFKKRLQRSPDRADALALSIHSPSSGGIVVPILGSDSGYRWNSGRGFG